MIWPEQPRFRRLHALLLCVLWLAGFELGPGLHIALHETIGHHHHGPAPQVAHHRDHEHTHGHAHGHGHHHHEVERAGMSRDHDLRIAEVVARRVSDPGHGAHALAHRGVAAMSTPPAWPPIAGAPWASLDRASRSFEPIRSRAPRSVRARAPPVSRLT